MQAILKGAGDSFILGCNHPIWPSFGLIHGSRSSDDIKRDWVRFRRVARQNLSRNWQNGRLWWNDPDAVVLSGDMPAGEYRFHATAAFASGGMILSGDDLTTLPPDRLEMLRKLLPASGRAARFDDETLRRGVVDLGSGRNAVCLLNWEDQAGASAGELRGAMRDVWTGETFQPGSHVPMPARSGRVLMPV
jgi:alpha-galactosidase